MPIRLNVEKSLEYPCFSPKIGTVNKTNPRAIYLVGKTYVSPNEFSYEVDTYKENIESLENDIRREISNYLLDNKFFEKKYILNFEVSEAGLRFGKKSYLFFQIFFSQKETPVGFIKLKGECEGELISLLSKIENCFGVNGFNIVEK